MKRAFIIAFLLIVTNLSIAQTNWLSVDERNEQTFPEMTFKDGGRDSFFIQYKFHGVWVSTKSVDGSDYQFINIPAFGKLGDIGKPALPMRNYPLAVPIGAEVKTEIVHADYQTFKGYLIHPALEPSRGGEERYFTLDEDFYRKDVFYPEDVVSTGSINIIRGFHFAYVRFCPVQYNPAKQELRIYTDIEVNISFVGWDNFFDPSQYSEDFITVFKNFVINGTDIAGPASLGKMATSSSGVSMLLVTHSDFSAAANRLARWNILRGFNTTVKTTAEIGSTSQQIKQYVHDTYQNSSPKPEYLLLLGDDNYVVSERYPGNNVSDLRYVCMDGDDDIYPEMAYGRISVATASNAVKVVDKIIAYEKIPPSAANFYSQGLSAGYFEDNGPRDGYEDVRFAETSEE